MNKLPTGQSKAISVSDTSKINKKVLLSWFFLFLEGSTRTAQVLLSLLYKAAECGAQVFIKMIFNSSAGRVIFHEYKDSVPLPEVIARNHGHENTALYLEEMTSRLVTHTTVLCFHSTLFPFFPYGETNYIKSVFHWLPTQSFLWCRATISHVVRSVAWLRWRPLENSLKCFPSYILFLSHANPQALP